MPGIARPAGIAAGVVVTIGAGVGLGAVIFHGSFHTKTAPSTVSHAATAMNNAAAAAPSASPTPSYDGPTISGLQMVDTLEHLLPAGGSFSATQGGPSGGYNATAALVYTDSAGTSGFLVTVGRFPTSMPRTAWTGLACAPIEARPYDHCTTHTVAGGAVLTETTSYTQPDTATGQKHYSVAFTRADGGQVIVDEWGGGAEKATTSAATPVLGVDRLAAIASSTEWDPAIATTLPQQAPPANLPKQLPGPKILSILTGLLPHGVAITDTDSEDGYGELIFDDGHGKTLIGVNVEPDSTVADISGGTVQLPDGTVAGQHTEACEKGGSCTEWIADTLTKTGLRVVIMEVNATSEALPADRTAPALSLDQLQAIATSPQWRQAP